MRGFVSLLFLCLIGGLASGLVAAPLQVGDHPVIQPMPGSHRVASQSQMKQFASYTFTVKQGNKSARMKQEGAYWKLRYLIRKANGRIDKSVSREEIVRNYKMAALEKGGEVLFEGGYLLTFTVPRKGGGTTWAFLSAGNGSYTLHIIDRAAFTKQLTFGAEELKKALDQEGHVAVYGILFDVDRASLKLGAEQVLIEMVKLMKQHPDLKLEIQGHTDNSGSAEHNRVLSRRRAETVKTFLLTYGIAASRMVPKGYGETRPVAPNDSEEGRARNRRVELVRIH